MDKVDSSLKENNPCPPNDLTDDDKTAYVLAVLDKFIKQYIFPTTAHSDDEDMSAAADDDDDDMSDGVFNYSLNLIKSFMVLLDCKDAVASGNGEHFRNRCCYIFHLFLDIIHMQLKC